MSVSKTQGRGVSFFFKNAVLGLGLGLGLGLILTLTLNDPNLTLTLKQHSFEKDSYFDPVRSRFC